MLADRACTDSHKLDTWVAAVSSLGDLAPSHILASLAFSVNTRIEPSAIDVALASAYAQ